YGMYDTTRAPSQPLCLVYEDFYLAIGYTFYEFIRLVCLMKRYLRWVLFLGLIIAPGESQCEDDGYKVRIVVDGDTIILLHGQRVRYIGIDAPEIQQEHGGGEPYGDKALALNRKLVSSRKVKLEFGKKRYDRYRRLLAYVFRSDGLFVNREMLFQGYAHYLAVEPEGPYARVLLQAQRDAMSVGKGMWKHRRGERGREGRYVGNRKSKRFHLSSCRFGKKIALKNRIAFIKKWDAFWAGYAPGASCIPHT
ncbi:MAG: thermonuclease family protein, partial [Desulfobacterales bacterium]